MTRITPEQAGGANRCAFLDMIAHSEIGADMLAKSDDGYDVLVGSTPSRMLLFTSYVDHPNQLNKQTNSTAAGRYQLLHRYWPAYKAQLGLPDFTPLSQDKVALQQILECHALPLVDAGHFAAAVAACAHIWASLPGSPYGQHTNALDDLATAYEAAGGKISATDELPA